jgi:hypothetical protein
MTQRLTCEIHRGDTTNGPLSPQRGPCVSAGPWALPWAALSPDLVLPMCRSQGAWPPMQAARRPSTAYIGH